MRNIISFGSINRAVLCCTLGAFTVSTVIPFQVVASPVKAIDINLNDINFGIRIEKLIEKAKKYFYSKDSNKLTDIMFDIKNEIEGYTGQKINIEQHLDQIEKEAKARGKPVDKAHMKEMRRRLKNQDKRNNHKAVYMASCLEYDLPFNVEEEALVYENTLVHSMVGVMAKGSHGKDKDDKEVVLPLRVTIGVTMSLVGLFLYVVPFPPCRACAPWVLETGIAFLIDQGFTEWENNEKKKDDKK